MEVLRTTAEDPFFVGTINCSDIPHHLFKLEDAFTFSEALFLLLKEKWRNTG